MTWNEIVSLNYLDELFVHSNEKPIYIFKHSSRCGISRMALKQIEQTNKVKNVELFLIDVLKNREISNALANKTGIKHESPQLIVIRRKNVIYHGSHSNIDLNNYE